jgi:glutathione synthase/RimK-type ligase-like ATP-grasp enzyme
MKKVELLFAQQSVEKGLAHPQALCDLLNGTTADISATWAYLDDLVYSLTNETVNLYDVRNEQPIEAYDKVYFRYWGAQEGHAVAAARICHLKGIPFIDSETLRVGSHNKLTQYVNLYESKVAFPRTLAASSENLLRYYEASGFSFPFIMKDKGGTRGQTNYLVRDETHMREIIQAHPGVVFVLQEFIPNDGDYRVLVAGSTVKLVIRRRAQGDSHLNNTSQGGSAEIVPNDELPEHVLEGCIRASKFYGREFAGVDIVHSKQDDTYYCFEVNRAPQIESASFRKEKAQILAELLAS